jgi:hypothetical protein
LPVTASLSPRQAPGRFSKDRVYNNRRNIIDLDIYELLFF